MSEALRRRALRQTGCPLQFLADLWGLLRLVWNEGHLGERRGGQASESSCNEIGHGDEVFDAAVAASTGWRFLECAVHDLDAAVVLAGVEAVEDAGEGHTRSVALVTAKQCGEQAWYWHYHA